VVSVRLAITLFVLVLLTLVGLGWRWTSAHQPAAKSAASHVVLGIAGASAVAALVGIWRHNPSRGRPGRS
jgi:hypothetical protein